MTKTTQNIMLYSILVVALFGAGLFLYSYKKGTKVNLPNLFKKGGAKDLPTPTGDLSRDLLLGSNGEEVKWLQLYLNTNHNSNLVMDGDFGPLTDKAIREAGISQPIRINELI